MSDSMRPRRERCVECYEMRPDCGTGQVCPVCALRKELAAVTRERDEARAQLGALEVKLRTKRRNSYRNDGQLLLETGHLSVCTNRGPVDECRNCRDVSSVTRLADTILRERWEAVLNEKDAIRERDEARQALRDVAIALAKVYFRRRTR